MSLLRHITHCNSFRADRCVALRHDGRTIGTIRRDNAEMLKRFPALFTVAPDAVTLTAGGGFEAVTAAVDRCVEQLVAESIVPKWRNEFFAVAPQWRDAPHFRLDRGAVPFFGTRAYGVHLNGYRCDGGRLLLWIGKRAADKMVAPGKLDNLVAGGIAWDHGLAATLAKEAEEEAAIPGPLIARARPAGAISYRMETRLGVRNDVLFVYDLELPTDFVPHNTDGEISEFTLMDAGEVMARVRDSDDVKFNVNLVLIDFALRHGIITPDERDYLALVTGLRRPLDWP